MATQNSKMGSLGGSSPESLVELLEIRAQERPHQLAYTFLLEGEEEASQLTYGELATRARAVGAALQAAGAGGRRALLLYPPSLEFIVAFFGCLYAGTVAVPAYPPRSQRSLPRLRSIALDARPAVALTTAELLPKLEALAAAAPDFGAMGRLATDDLPAGVEEGWRDPQVDGDTLAFLQYTSGSTAAPKGVMVSHGNLLHNQEMIRQVFHQSEESVIVGWLPLYHDMGLIGNVLQPLYVGGRCILMSPLDFLQKPIRWLRAISHYRATTSGGPNFSYELCVAKISEQQRQGLDLSSWQVAFNGAEPVRSSSMEAFAQAYGPYGFRSQAFLPCYGLAEGTLLVTGSAWQRPATVGHFAAEGLEEGFALSCQAGASLGNSGPGEDSLVAPAAEGDSGSRALVGCGPTEGEQVLKIVDTESDLEKGGVVVPEGKVGEIWVAGPSVAQGYWQQSEATQETFRCYLADGSGPFLRTGDLGFVTTGELFITGRQKDLIILRGRNYYPQDIELSAEMSHPALRRGCTAAFSVDVEGPEQLVVVQEVRREARGMDMEPVVRALSRAVHEGHDLEVSDVVLVAPGSVPKTSSGKVQRRACRASLLKGKLKVWYSSRLSSSGVGTGPHPTSGSGVATDSGVATESGAAAPAVAMAKNSGVGGASTSASSASTLDRQTLGLASPEQQPHLLLEHVIATAAGILQVDVARLEPEASLFLDSLAAMELKASLEEALAVRLPLEIFFEGPSPRRLVEELGRVLLGAQETASESPLTVAAARAFRRQELPAESPLSSGQQALWFLQRLSPASSAYNVHCAMKVRGSQGASDVDVAALRRALAMLMTRHRALRTTFPAGADGPRLRVLGPETELPWTQEATLSTETLGEGAADENLSQRLAELAHRPFDLESSPPVRGALLAGPAEGSVDAVLLLSFHHLAVDLWSLVILARELGELYDEEVSRSSSVGSSAVGSSEAREAGAQEGDAGDLIGYEDFVGWQQELLAGPRGQELEGYWRTALAGAPAILNLPTDHPRLPSGPRRGASLPFEIELPTVELLQRMATAVDGTLFASLLASLQVLLGRLSGQRDLLVGSPATGRDRPGLAAMVGYLVNPLPLRGQLTGDPSFEEFLRRTRQTVVGALEHQDYPFPLLVEKLKPQRELGRSPLFQVMLTLERPHRLSKSGLSGFVLGRSGSQLTLGGLELESVEIAGRDVQFDLELVLAESSHGVEAVLHYDAELFDATSAARLTRQYSAVLKAAASSPQRRLSELPLLTPAEQHQALLEWNPVEWNPVERDATAEKQGAASKAFSSAPDGAPGKASFQLLIDPFLSWAHNTPEAAAIVEEDGRGGQRIFTYRELEEGSRQVALALCRSGVRAETRVAVALPRGASQVAAFLGVLRSGAVYLPLDPAYPEDRLAFMLQDSAAPWVVTDAAGGQSLGLETAASQPLEIGPLGEGRGLLLASSRPDAPSSSGEEAPLFADPVLEEGLPQVDPDGLAYAIYTSGSTGRPKGVLLGHRGLANLAHAQSRAFGVDRQSRVLFFAALSFDASVSEMAMAVASGAALCVAPEQEMLPGSALAKLLERLEISHVTLPPSSLAALPATPLPALRSLICAGESLAPALVNTWGADRRLFNAYGPTETTVCASWAICEPLGARTGATTGSGTGPGSRAGSTDASGGRADGDSPELSTSPHEATSGRDSSRLEASKLAPTKPSIGRPLENVQCYVLDGQGKSSPVGVVGELYVGGLGVGRGYLGRPGLTAERFVPAPFSALPGQRMYRTGDLARWLSRGEIDFLGRRDQQLKIRGFRIEPGEVEAALAGHSAVAECVVAAATDPSGGGHLVAYVVAGEEEVSADQLKDAARRQLPPSMIPARIVFLEKLPRSPAGKLDRQALPAAQPRVATGTGAGKSALPRSEREQAVAEVWRRALGLAQVGLDDNFFDLGGHSLLVTRVHGDLQPVLGDRLTLVDLFRYPTIRSLVAAFGEASVGESALASARVRGRKRSRGEHRDGSIAVVGLACRFPGASNPAAFWKLLREGREAVEELSDDQLLEAGVSREQLGREGFVKKSVLLDGIDRFDAGYFGYSPREAIAMDPQHRLFLECAVEALESAGCNPEDEATNRTVGVYAGAGLESYMLYQLGLGGGAVDPAEVYQLSVGNLKDFLASRVAYALDLRGPAVAVQTACSTSLVAVHLACQSLLSGEIDVALAGGSSLEIPQAQGYRYQPGMIFSPDGHCRPFDAAAQGTVRGSGTGIVVLKRLAEAVADGDSIRAILRGSAVNNDGRQKVGYTAPSVECQAAVIAEALEMAEATPESISYVEAHGTGTELGDPIEMEALSLALGSQERRGACAVGSVKSNLGHLDTAAGVAGLIKTVLALEHRELPASLGFEQPNPKIDFSRGPFAVNHRLQPWPAENGPRRAGVSSFGIGGTNAHLVLEEAPPRSPGGASRPHQLLLLSAQGEEPLFQAAVELADHLESRPEIPLADAAFTLQRGRRSLGHRMAVVAEGREEAISLLRGEEPEVQWIGTAPGSEPSVAFLFPGQGSQHLGMAASLYRNEEGFRRRLDHCAEILRVPMGIDLRELLGFSDPSSDHLPAEGSSLAQAKERLTATRFAQPALFAVEYSLAGLWSDWGLKPDAYLGHSIGEWVAACLAGVFTLEDALALVAERGRLMGEMSAGAMLSVSLPAEEVEDLLAGRGHQPSFSPDLAAALETLEVAVINGPRSTVVSGPRQAVVQLEKSFKEEGIPCRLLATSHAFHSAMMEPAVVAFEKAVAQRPRSTPRLPFLSNVSGDWIRSEEAVDASYWAAQLRQPVRFAAAVGRLLEDPSRLLLEVGPGQALTTLARRQEAFSTAHRALASLPAAKSREDDSRFLLTTLGRLWLSGIKPQWQHFYGAEERRRQVLPTYPFQSQRYWAEPAVAAPQPSPESDSIATAAQRRELKDWFYLPYWQPSVAPPRPAPAAGEKWLLFEDQEGLGEEMARQLRNYGAEVVSVVPGSEFQQISPDLFHLRPGSSVDLESLFQAVEGAGRLPRRVVHLGSVTSVTNGESVSSVDLELGFYSLLGLGQAIGRRTFEQPIRLTVVTTGAQRVTFGDAPLPARAAIHGPARVLPQESPALTCRSVDITLPKAGPALERLARRLLAEEPSDGLEPPVAYRGESRWEQTARAVSLPELPHGIASPEARSEEASSSPTTVTPQLESDLLLRRRGVYLITGGFGGLGRVFALELARRWQARLVLTGRRVPEAESWRELEEAGAEVMATTADVADVAAMTEVVRSARQRFGRLDGVIHAAGVAGDGVAQRKTVEDAAAVLAPKVLGGPALEAALGAGELDFLLLFSSLAAPLGGFGQVDYSAANNALDAFAEGFHCRHPGTLCCSIAWGAWKDQGMAARADSRLGGLRQEAASEEGSDQGLRAAGIDGQEGIDAFYRVLANRSAPRILVSPQDFQALTQAYGRSTDAEELLRQAQNALADQLQDSGEPRRAHPRPPLQNRFVKPEGELERTLAQIWQGQLAIEGIGSLDNFFELGGTSLVGIQVVAEIKRQLGVEVPAASLYEGPSIKGLARVIERLQKGSEEPTETLVDSRGRGALRRQRMARRRGPGGRKDPRARSSPEVESKELEPQELESQDAEIAESQARQPVGGRR